MDAESAVFFEGRRAAIFHIVCVGQSAGVLLHSGIHQGARIFAFVWIRFLCVAGPIFFSFPPPCTLSLGRLQPFGGEPCRGFSLPPFGERAKYLDMRADLWLHNEEPE
jgi:hypothetical protein